MMQFKINKSSFQHFLEGQHNINYMIADVAFTFQTEKYDRKVIFRSTAKTKLYT